MRLKRRHDKGIGLVEILCVLAIVAITTSFAATQMQHMRQRQFVSARTAEFEASARFARDQAISLGTRVSICRTQGRLACVSTSAAAPGFGTTDPVSRDWASGWAVFTDSDPRGEINGDDRVLWSEGTWATGSILQADRAGKYVLSYQPTGIGLASAMSFVVSPERLSQANEGQSISQTICISLAGQVRHVEGKCQ